MKKKDAFADPGNAKNKVLNILEKRKKSTMMKVIKNNEKKVM